MSSMRSILRGLALLAALLCGFTPAQDELPVQYQERHVLDWAPELGVELDPAFQRNALERHAELMAQGHYPDVLAALAEEFRASPWTEHLEQKAKFQREMDAVVAAFREAWKVMGDGAEVPTLDERSNMLAALKARGRGGESLLPRYVKSQVDPDEDVQVFFEGSPENRFQTFEFPVDPSAETEILVPADKVLELRLRGDTFSAVMQSFVEPLQKKALAIIQRADRQWTNYLEEGYSQYPWESLVNGWLWDFSAFDPPDKQLILLHPTLGLESSTVSLDGMTVNEAISLELIGYVGYYGSDHERFLGGSITATLRDDIGPGLGAVVHWSQNFSLGVSWHDVDDDDDLFDDDPFVFLSFDLFRFLQAEGPKYKAEYDRVRARLAEL